MKRSNVRLLLLYFISGCLAVVALASTLAESQDRPKKITPPLAPPHPRTGVLRTTTDTHVFDYPTIGPSWVVVRLDWCREWSANCGKPAADAYCDSLGYLKAAKFEIQEHVGHTTTIGVTFGLATPLSVTALSQSNVWDYTPFSKSRG